MNDRMQVLKIKKTFFREICPICESAIVVVQFWRISRFPAHSHRKRPFWTPQGEKEKRGERGKQTVSLTRSRNFFWRQVSICVIDVVDM